MLIFSVVTALVISMVTIPLLALWAPRLRMVDLPDARKVHDQAMPRVGGIGIVLGALASILLWVPLEDWLVAYLAGSMVLLVFGALDDSLELGHYTKFVGQFIATIGLVYWGDLWVAHLPFIDGEVDPAFGKPFTVVALVGMINAVNHSDGLDGLAGGESLLSLACIAYLAHLAGGVGLIVLVGAVAGGVFGFLRYNTHPAGVFMGDAGSQFLGFSLGVLTIYLTQRLSPDLSMALPALILGLPIADILAVFAQRIHGGMNWFRATKNHIHHRLLHLGFRHYQAVMIIYSVQALLVGSALLLSHESDALILAVYVGACGAVFALLTLAERRGWHFDSQTAALPDSSAGGLLSRPGLRRAVARFVEWSVPAYLVARSLTVQAIPSDYAAAATMVAVLTAGSLVFVRSGFASAVARLAIYSGCATVVSLLEHNGAFGPSAWGMLDAAYFVLLAVAVGALVRLDPDFDFRTTPLDLLLMFVVIVAGLLAQHLATDYQVGNVIFRTATLFYACELVLNRARGSSVSVLKSALVLASVALLARSLLTAG